jgi:site-specific recombinase XerC
VVVANDLVSGRSVQRSFTVHGDRESAEQRRRELAGLFGVDRGALYCEGARWSVAELLGRFIAAEHQWRPATRSSHASVVRFLISDTLARVGVAVLAPVDVEEAMRRWRASGGSAALVWGRWAVLHSALSWAARQGLIRANPILGMRAPGRPEPRQHLLPEEVALLLRTAADSDQRRRTSVGS